MKHLLAKFRRAYFKSKVNYYLINFFITLFTTLLIGVLFSLTIKECVIVFLPLLIIDLIVAHFFDPYEDGKKQFG